MTAATRKASERARKRAQGLSPLEVWAPKELHQKIKDYVKKITKGGSGNAN